MKRLIMSLAVVGLTASASAAAAADTVLPLQHGTYATVSAGLNIISPTIVYDSYIPANLRFKFNQGWAIDLAGGYKWSCGLRTEIELGYHENGFSNFNTSIAPLAGRQATFSAMGNVLYDFNTGTRFTPYVGVGAGATMAWWKRLSQPNLNLTVNRNSNSNRFAVQGIAGVAVAITPGIDAVVDVRYKGSNGYKFVVGGGYISNVNLRETTMLAGLRFAL